ncbi:Coiled-coil domain-containing protein 103 [Hondaea fermentalgiana]|uniref:Coiled-coil domain-containing protein 103 n=1 Tax=Hondaea fermentalgiana TaxID=2315210 RepID=A0A2R5GQP0_9STRA|nr:Coiled-coil domain-containing protein 103 [Hondaea fermentalgiana]|eukprot:GBG33192.1 Coiled-coil domain-containing protein 103 [Hondaea fermentalgiana]
METAGLDEKTLRRELATAAEADRRRKDVDEMKKRSVMTAGSYSEFRNLVACAQEGQRPVSRKEMDFIGNPGKPEGFMYSHLRKADWKSKFQSSSTARQLLQRHHQQQQASLGSNRASGSGNSNQESETVEIPTSQQDFDRFWRRKDLSEAQRCNVLLELDTSKVFSVGVDDLSGLVRCLHSSIQSRSDAIDRVKLASLLDGLSRVPRFSLAIDFLGKADREIVATLISFVGRPDLAAQFKVPNN